MLFGIGLPQRKGYTLRDDVIRVATGAEQAGFTSLWVYERLLFPTEPRNGLYGIDGLPWIDAYQQAADSLTVLTAAAAVTERIKLGTCVLVAPLHQPLPLAKALATIDNLSGGGRLIAGLGTGWSLDEREAVGDDGTAPGVRLDETIDVLRTAWSEDPVDFQSKHSTVRSALVLPKPLGPIPIMIGSSPSAVAVERLARTADGWLPVALPAAVIGSTWEGITKRAAEHGRDPGAMKLIPRANVVLLDEAFPDEGRYPFVGSLDQIVGDAVACAEAGADELILEFQLQDRFPAGAAQILELATTVRDRALAVLGA